MFLITVGDDVAVAKTAARAKMDCPPTAGANRPRPYRQIPGGGAGLETRFRRPRAPRNHQAPSDGESVGRTQQRSRERALLQPGWEKRDLSCRRCSMPRFEIARNPRESRRANSPPVEGQDERKPRIVPGGVSPDIAQRRNSARDGHHRPHRCRDDQTEQFDQRK